MKKMMIKTALIPFMDLAIDAGVPNADMFLKKLTKGILQKTSGYSYLAESRYKTAESIIKLNKYKQILELGSGFTPHAVNLAGNADKYIEVDYPENIAIKKKLTRDLTSAKEGKIIYIAGDIFSKTTWQKIQKEILKKPIGIFAEGFMQYTNKRSRVFLLGEIKDILTKNGGSFFFEDSLTFHPEFSNIKTLKGITEKMFQISRNKNLHKYISQGELTREFERLSFKVKRIKAHGNLNSGSYNTEESRLVIKKFKHWQLSV